VHTIEWWFMNAGRRTFQADSDTLAERARRARSDGTHGYARSAASAALRAD
jgi:hypothetical protein